MVESVETVIGQINRKSGGLGMPYVSPVVENDFKDRLNKCVDIIKNSSIKYQSFGIFGSYARNDYKASSDIDFCIIVPEKPERWMMGALREELEMLHANYGMSLVFQFQYKPVLPQISTFFLQFAVPKLQPDCSIQVTLHPLNTRIHCTQ